MNLEDIIYKIKKDFTWASDCFIEGNEIIISEPYEIGDDEKNDDDCCDYAKENGELIIEKFPMLEISNYYCHRHKYAVVSLILK